MTKIQIDRALLAQHIAEIDAWNASMEQILGRQPEHKWLSLEALRAACEKQAAICIDVPLIADYTDDQGRFHESLFQAAIYDAIEAAGATVKP